jgi:VWFA-related protein
MGVWAMFRKVTAIAFCPLIAFPLNVAAQAGQAAQSQPQTTIHATADLVVVDVTASDDKQNPVHHLTAANFTVLEDGKPQTLKVFEEHAAGPPAPLPPMPKFAPGMFSNFTTAPQTGPLNILLFDKLNTPENAQMVVRQQVLKFLKEAPPGTRMAIFALTTELKLLQGFTSDPELLKAMVEGKKGNAGASPLMNDAMRGDAPGADDPMMDTATEALGNAPDAAMVLANLQQFEADQQSFQLQLRARYTLDALNQLARYLSNLPGRKNLIWFSGSFPVSILPDPDLQNPFSIVASAEDEFRETVDLLSRSQVSVYPIDARGLMTEPMMDVANSGSGYSKNPGAFAKNSTKFFQQTSEEHGTMNEMAQATGGEAFVNTNGLTEAVEKAINEGSNYYTVAYSPTDQDWNGKYRKIQVKIDRPGVTLEYRRGYYADDPLGPENRPAAQIAKADPAQYSAIRTAMLHGGPDPTQFIFVASVRPSTAETETALAQGNEASKKFAGPYRRYSVIFVANPRQVNWTVAPDGSHHCILNFLTFVYDVDGKLMNMQTNGISVGVGADKFASMLQHNLEYTQQISVPVKGEYYLRIGMRDGNTDRVGALELPVAAVAKLAPLSAEGAAPAVKPASK